MGVTYKLTEEVTLFILEKKKLEPSLSVRKLAQLASQKFQTEISKSSVNTVLKNASLSSAIGRPSKEKEEESPPSGKNFKIPEKRKRELRDRVEKAEKSILESKPPVSKEEKTKVVDQLRAALEAFEAPEEKVKIKETEIEKEDVRPTLMPDLLREPAVKEKIEPPTDRIEKISEQPQEKSEEKQAGNILARIDLLKQQRAHSKKKYSGAGGVFLKAIEDMVAKEPLLPQLISQHSDFQNNIERISSWDTVVSLYSLGAKSLQDIEALKNHLVWVFHKEDDPCLEEVLSRFHSFETTRGFLMDYDAVKAQLGMQVSGFQIVTNDGKNMFFDSHGHLLSEGQRSKIMLPFYQAMRNLSEKFISNKRDIVILPGDAPAALSGTHRDFIALCETMGDRQIKSIIILDDKNQKISEITTAPHKRRNFVFGLGPDNQEFKDWQRLADFERKTPFYCERLNSVGYFVEINYVDAELKRTSGDFRVIYFWNDDKKEPLFALMVNHGGQKAELLLNDFLNQYLSSRNHLNIIGLRDFVSSQTPAVFLEKLYYPQELDDLEDVFKNYEEIVWHLCWQVFFAYNGEFKNISDLKTALYALDAEIFETDKAVFISFLKESVSSDIVQIQSAMDVFNISCIQDVKDRPIILSFD